jgi:hypothetical protein
MALKIEKFDVWSGEVLDRAGGVVAALKPLVEAGANLTFLIGHRRMEKPGTGVIFFGGLQGDAQSKAAESAGFSRSVDVAVLRVEGPDEPARLHQITSALANAGINLRAITTSASGSQCVAILAFDNSTDRDNAARVLTKL